MEGVIYLDSIITSIPIQVMSALLLSFISLVFGVLFFLKPHFRGIYLFIWGITIYVSVIGFLHQKIERYEYSDYIFLSVPIAIIFMFLVLYIYAKLKGLR